MRSKLAFFYAAGFIALAKIAVHLFFIGEYDYFRDELYYLACSDRLALGYVDQPPLSILLLKLTRLLLGDALWAIRLPAVLAGGGLVLLTAALARELGGGRFGVALAALAVALAPIYLGLHKFFSMNAFDLLFWAGAFLLVLRVLKTDATALWCALGVLLGLGLLNKHSLLFFGFGLAIGLVATPYRRLLLRPGPYLAGGIALVLFAPNLYWQFANDAPTLEFMTNARLYKNVAFAPLDFLGGVLLEVHPAFAPLWIAGLVALLRAKRDPRWRVPGVLFVSLLALFMFTGGKTYYLAAAFPPLFAAGAVVLESLVARAGADPATDGRPGRSLRTALRTGIVGWILMAGTVTLPLALPALPIRTYLKYQAWLGIGPPAHERHHVGAVPQHFADMFGWRELAAGTAAVYDSLAPAERKRVTIVGRNYGFAGAIEFFGRSYGLPRPVSGHNNYFLWGYGDSDLDPVIAAGIEGEDLRKYFKDVRQAAIVSCEFCLPDRRETRIYVCRGLKVAPAEAWRRIKIFI